MNKRDLKYVLLIIILLIIYTWLCFTGEGYFLKVFYLIAVPFWIAITALIYTRQKEPLLNEDNNDTRFILSMAILGLYLIPIITYKKVVANHEHIYLIFILIYSYGVLKDFIKLLRKYISLRK